MSKLRLELIQDRALYIYVLLSTILLYMLIGDNYRINYTFFSYLETLHRVIIGSFFAWSIYYYIKMAFTKEPRPLKRYMALLFSFIQEPHKVISSLALLLLLYIVISCYTYLKSIIPDINPFRYDVLFYEIDKWIHFDTSPWIYTHYIFDNHLATFILNLLYNLWFFIMWATVIYFIVNRNMLNLRQQFLLSFMSSWLTVGGVMAVLLSSAGPCYLFLIDNTQTAYLPLLELLENQSRELESQGLSSLWSLNTQHMLWQKHLIRDSGIGSGISAMPSMHVSISILIALASYKVNKKVGYLMWFYAFTILIGSVHLGWHYAIDGYVSIVLTIALWKVSGKITTSLR